METHEQQMEKLRRMKRKAEQANRDGKIISEELRQLREKQKALRAKWESRRKAGNR